MLELRGVSKSFRGASALESVDISIERGECLCVLGEPGAGKTTLLRLIAGLEEPDTGEILIEGEETTHVYPGKRDVAMVFDNLGLYPNQTVFENIASPLKARKVHSDQIAPRVQKVASVLRIEALLERRPLHLSGGERQRVAIGRALVRRPKILLMDEPLSNLDALLRVEMRAELNGLKREFGSTLIYTTHDEVEAVSLGDRIAVLDRGAVQQIAPPSEIYEAPANVVVARTVGTPPMNMLAGELRKSATGTLFAHPEFELSLNLRSESEVSAEGSATLGIRPEHMQYEQTKSAPHLDAEVYAVEPLGVETIVDVKVADEILKVVAPPGFRADIGSRIPIGLPQEPLLLFDAEGRALGRVEAVPGGLRPRTASTAGAA